MNKDSCLFTEIFLLMKPSDMYHIYTQSTCLPFEISAHCSQICYKFGRCHKSLIKCLQLRDRNKMEKLIVTAMIRFVVWVKTYQMRERVTAYTEDIYEYKHWAYCMMMVHTVQKLETKSVTAKNNHLEIERPVLVRLTSWL